MEIVPTSIAESICGTSCLGLSGQKNGDITCRMEGSGQISSLGLRDLGVPPSKNVNFNCSFHVAVKRALRPRFMPAARRVIRLLSCPSVPNRIRCRRAPVWGAALRVAPSHGDETIDLNCPTQKDRHLLKADACPFGAAPVPGRGEARGGRNSPVTRTSRCPLGCPEPPAWRTASGRPGPG